MNTTLGAVLLVIAVMMLWLARSRDGEPIKPFRKIWVVGQLYALAVMSVGIMGIAMILNATG
jgi:quinol-cytochrome oxidoreductase complex cytochrome b subunit